MRVWVQRSQPYWLAASAFCVPVGEGIALASLGVFVAATLVAAPRSFWAPFATPAVRTVGMGLAGWCVFGAVSCAVSGVWPRTMHLNRAVLVVAAVAGVYLTQPLPLRVYRLVLCAFGAGVLVACGTGLAQYMWGTFPGEATLLGPPRGWRGQLYIPDTMVRAASGTLLNRMKLAKVLSFAVLTAAPLALVARRGWRAAAVLVAVTAGGVLGLTHVIAGWLAVLVALLVVGGAAAWRPSGHLVGLMLIMGVLVTMATPALLGARANLEVESSTKLGTRALIWGHALEIIADHPWLGVGFGNYSRVAPRYFPGTPAPEQDARTMDAHNQHLTVLGEGGVVGFVCWFLLLLGAGRLLVSAWNAHRATALATMLLGWSVVVLVMMSAHDYLFHPHGALLFWLAIGVAAGLAHRAAAYTDTP